MDNPNQTSQAQEVNSKMPSIDNNFGKSKLIPIILGVAVVIVIAIGAYVLGAKQSQPVVQNNTQTTPSPSPIPTIDETANWKTYINEKTNFSIKYPPYLQVVEQTDKDQLQAPRISTIILVPKDKEKGSSVVSLYIDLKPESQSILEYWAESFRYSSHTGESTGLTEEKRLQMAQKFMDDTERVLIGNEKLEGFKYTRADVLAITSAVWFKNDKVYSLSFSPDDKSYGYTKEQKEQIFDQILSTFQFTP